MTAMDLFQILDESSKKIMKESNFPYLEALIHSAENLIDNGSVYNEDKVLSEELVEQLKSLYSEVELEELTPETIRKAMQLAILSGTKEDYVQPNHQMTPDSIGTLIAYLIELIAEPKDQVHIADLAVGTGNLLLTIHHFLKQSPNREMTLSGVDNDELMLSLASTNSTIQRTPVRLLFQDALMNLFIQPADIMVSDLPLGYYPLEEPIKDYKTRFTGKEEKSYSHYLLIEQSLNYLNENGFGFFLLPNQAFNDENISVLVDYLKDVGYIQGIINLPKEIFANEASRKAVFVIQKQGAEAQQVKEVLFINAPDFKDLDAMKSFLGEITKWKQDNK